MQKRRLILTFFLLILVILAEIFMLVRCTGNPSDQTDSPQMTASPTAVIVTQAPTATPTPTEPPAAATAAPATEIPTTPAPTPDPTPDPTDTPAPTATPSYGIVIAEGSFSSDTGTSMNMNVNWVAYDDGSGSAVIALTGTVTSYSLQLASLYDSVTLEMAGYSVTCNTRSIYLEDGVGQTTSPLFYTTLTVPLGTCADMTAVWRYGGSYSGVSLETVTAAGYIYTS